MKSIDDVIALANATVAKAERCRLEVQAAIEKEPNRCEPSKLSEDKLCADHNAAKIHATFALSN